MFPNTAPRCEAPRSNQTTNAIRKKRTHKQGHIGPTEHNITQGGTMSLALLAAPAIQQQSSKQPNQPRRQRQGSDGGADEPTDEPTTNRRNNTGQSHCTPRRTNQINPASSLLLRLAAVMSGSSSATKSAARSRGGEGGRRAPPITHTQARSQL